MKHLLLALGLLGIALNAPAQLSVDWFSIDGGGGTSAGGDFTVTGTIGQPDAGRLAGGDYTVEGGLWPGLIVASGGDVPNLYIRASGATVEVRWSPASPGFQLQVNGSLSASGWAAGPAGNPASIPLTGQAMFFRLRKE
jgi:hypothetical protein